MSGQVGHHDRPGGLAHGSLVALIRAELALKAIPFIVDLPLRNTGHGTAPER